MEGKEEDSLVLSAMGRDQRAAGVGDALLGISYRRVNDGWNI